MLIPTRARIEGQITLIIPNGEQVIKHHLPFSETLDSILGKSTTSIGYVARKANKYYTRRSLPTLTLDTFGNCNVLRETLPFIPELGWFAQELLPNIKSMQLNPGGLVGPTGLLGLATQLTSSVSVSI